MTVMIYCRKNIDVFRTNGRGTVVVVVVKAAAAFHKET
jgi:hypothetical protein